MQTAPEAAELAGFQGKREEEKKKNRSVLDLFHRPFLKKEKGKKKERVGADIRHRSEPKLLLFFAENRFKEVVSGQMTVYNTFERPADTEAGAADLTKRKGKPKRHS